MKIVFIDNEFDNNVSARKRAEFEAMRDELLARHPNAEAHVMPFGTLRNALPISTAPCVFILFDELVGDFDTGNIEAIINAVEQLGLPRPS